jgi:hypothetical protein
MPTNVRPMLATLVHQPFDRRGWLFEIKWDGSVSGKAKDQRAGNVGPARVGLRGALHGGPGDHLRHPIFIGMLGER